MARFHLKTTVPSSLQSVADHLCAIMGLQLVLLQLCNHTVVKINACTREVHGVPRVIFFYYI